MNPLALLASPLLLALRLAPALVLLTSGGSPSLARADARNPELALSDTAQWESQVAEIARIPDPVEANARITRAHHDLAVGLHSILGEDSGANFHAWATWGSLKAGTSIREEDIPALRSLTESERRNILCSGNPFALLLPDCALAALTQAELDRVRSAISEGNRAVLSDIGRATARFVRHFEREAVGDPDPALLARYLVTLSDDPVQGEGRGLLPRAFTAYWRARHEGDLKRKHELMLLGNLYAILHEHYLLQPIIDRAMPLGLRTVSTALLLKFRIGDETLSVSEDVPAYPPNGGVYPWSLRSLDNEELVALLDRWDHSIDTFRSAAHDWTHLEDRMNYICSLFRTRHLKAELFELP